MIAQLRFDDRGLEPVHESAQSHTWKSQYGDEIDLSYLPGPPAIDADLLSVADVRQFYRRIARELEMGLVEADLATCDGCHAVHVIAKARQLPSGMIYLGTITLPFRDFSYVIKVRCAEQGLTGLRDSLVFVKALGDGSVTYAEDGTPKGWTRDPYGDSTRSPLMWNQSDARKYDTFFVDHPLSRARRLLECIEASISVDEELRASPPFDYRRARV
jgi:hypothetical protein